MGNPHPSPTSRRKPNTPNKFGVERALAVERSGKKLPPANLLAIAEDCMAMVEHYRPGAKDNPKDEERYAFWLERACDALAKAAPYYSPKLHAIAIAKPVDIDDKVGRVDPREQMWQTYKAMRERGEIAMKTMGSSGNGSSPHTPAVEAVVVDEEDNGDGDAV